MSKYIVADDLKMELIGLETEPTDEDIERVIDNMPTADVAPVVPGWWERVDSSYYRWTPSGGTLVDCATYRCSHCGRGTAVKSNYCPNCGCRMDGEDGEHDGTKS